MTSECVEIVNWLKNWFKPRDEQYTYDITVSNNNPTIDTDVTVEVSVTDGNDDAVSNHTFQLLINGGSSISLTTDSQGSASYVYTCSDWGVYRFSVGPYSNYIRVKGWRNFRNDANFTGYYNETDVFLSVHVSNVSVGTSWSEFSADVIPTSNPDLTPQEVVVSPVGYNARILIRIKKNSSHIERASISGSGFSGATVNADVMWKRK